MKLLTQTVLSRYSYQVIERYEDFSKNKALTQKLKCMMRNVDEDFIEVYDEKCFHLHACLKSKSFSSASRCECLEDFE